MKKRQSKYVFITGGVVSSLGKGITAASAGALMESRGLKINLLKMDPYINVDPGTMSPFQHGEVFVTDDGAETDLDLGHYERFTSVSLSKSNNFTSGQVYEQVINNERQGKYLGGTVQVIPHVTNEIKGRIRALAENHDLVICEVGGTVGDIESLPFLEAIRQFRYEVGPENVIYLHVTLVPYLAVAGELKTKPTQHSVKELRSIGIQPDLILCRSDRPIPSEIKKKIALFCNVAKDEVISMPDADSIYKIPLMLQEEGLDDKMADKLNIWSRAARLERWENVLKVVQEPNHKVRIGIIGKYVDLTESYKSLNEALSHAGIANDAKVECIYLDAEKVESGELNSFDDLDGILVPGGFGERGSEGKITSIRMAREQKIPFFGICLGMQMAVVEFARNICSMSDANSTEFNKNSAHPVVHLMAEQHEVTQMGATMRLGAYPCALKEGSLAAELYKGKEVSERHRHRYEINNSFRDQLSEGGLIFSGLSPDRELVEMIELPTEKHPFFVGCQFHPEFRSRLFQPHPIFEGFIRASLAYQKDQSAS